MEERAAYGPWQERPRLIVVKDGAATYSALPHVVLLDARLSYGARLLYAVLQSHWWQSGECFARHDVLAAEMAQGGQALSGRQLRRYLDELIGAGYIVEVRKGHGQAKSYSPRQVDTEVQFNKTPVSTYEPNKTPVSDQQDTGVSSNKTPVSDLYKKTPVKKTKEKLATTLLGAASAAEPATTATKAKTSNSKKTACPQTFPLEARHFEYGADLGLSETRVRAETDKFLAHHRFKGTLGLDWYAGWQNWMRRAVTYDAPRANGAPPMSPGSASKQKSSWADSGFRVKRLVAEGFDGR